MQLLRWLSIVLCIVYGRARALSFPLPQSSPNEAVIINSDQQRDSARSCSHIAVGNWRSITEKVLSQLETTFDAATARYIEAALEVSSVYCELDTLSAPLKHYPDSGKQVFYFIICLYLIELQKVHG